LADAGVPMLMLIFPAAFFLLVPIIGIETWCAHHLKTITSKRRFLGVLTANAVSTIVGWPLTWIILALLQLFVIPGGDRGDFNFPYPFDVVASVTLGAAWLPPDENNLYWMIPTATMVLLIPAFFVTILAEKLVLRFFWRDLIPKERKSFVWIANFASYGLLYLILICWLLFSITHFHKHL
ncbi:MAG: hypothetical protein ACREFE_15190, partial [Limisphaerales bacterium]